MNMNVEEYIAAQPDSVQPVLCAVRAVIRNALPEAEERIAWQMPTYRIRYDRIHFAAAKAHIGIYPGPEAVEAFRKELEETGLRFSKGSIRFPMKLMEAEVNEPGRLMDLIRRISVWCTEDR